MCLSIIMNELYTTNDIIINDNNKILIDFYKCLKKNQKELLENINMLNKLEIINNYKLLLEIVNNKYENIFKKSSAYYISNKIVLKVKCILLKLVIYHLLEKKRKKPLNIDINKFNKFSVLLDSVELHNKNVFDNYWLDHIKPDDIVILDPPYDSINKCFTNYGSVFNRSYHEKLFRFIKKINEIKCKVIAFNNNTAFIKYLYKDFNIDVFHFKSKINGKKIEELLIFN